MSNQSVRPVANLVKCASYPWSLDVSPTLAVVGEYDGSVSFVSTPTSKSQHMKMVHSDRSALGKVRPGLIGGSKSNLNVYDVRFNAPRYSHVAAVSQNGIVVFDVRNEKRGKGIEHAHLSVPIWNSLQPMTPFSVDFWPAGGSAADKLRFAVGTKEGKILFFSWENGVIDEPAASLPPPSSPSPIFALRYSKSGKKLVAGTMDGTLFVYNLVAGSSHEIQATREFKTSLGISSLSIALDETWMLLGNSDKDNTRTIFFLKEEREEKVSGSPSHGKIVVGGVDNNCNGINACNIVGAGDSHLLTAGSDGQVVLCPRTAAPSFSNKSSYSSSSSSSSALVFEGFQKNCVWSCRLVPGEDQFILAVDNSTNMSCFEAPGFLRRWSRALNFFLVLEKGSEKNNRIVSLFKTEYVPFRLCVLFC